MRIDSSGNVGIGLSTTSPLTTTPWTNLQVNGANVSNPVASRTSGTPPSNLHVSTNGYGADQGGSISLGSQPDNVNNYAAYGSIAGRRNSSLGYVYSGYLQFNTSDGTNLNEQMRIDSSGNVGIGKSSSLGAKLHIQDDSATDATPVKLRNYKASVNTKVALMFELSTSAGQGGNAVIKGVCGTDAGGTDNQNDGGLEFQTSSGGAGTLATALLINKDRTLQLPSGSPGIGFGSSTSADLLDDYEEGTWTPVLKSGTDTITYSGGNSQFTYTKVGRVVTVNFSLNNETTAGTTGGTFVVEGLPYAAISTQSNRFIGTIVNYYNIGLYLNGWPAYVHLDAGQSKINVYYKTAASGTYDATTVSNVGNNSFMQWQVTYFT